MKKFAKKVSMLVLVLALMLVGAVGTVFADTPPTGTEENPLKAYLTKAITMGDATTTPSGDAEFIVTPKTVDGEAYDEALSNMPKADVKITFSASDEGTVSDGVKTVIKQGELLPDAAWPHAGTYVYEVNEKPDTFVLGANETMSYSGAKYKVTFVVANGTNGLYVKYAAVEILVKDTTEVVGDKVSFDKETTVNTGNGFRFTNNYIKKTIVNPEDPSAHDKGLLVSKTVTGEMGDKSKYFDFTITATAPGNIPEADAPVFNAQIVNDDGSAITDGANNGVAADGKVIITSGQAQTFKLKHGQRLVFTDLIVGTVYTAEETNAFGHTMSVVQTANGVVKDPAGEATIGENANSFKVTNNKDAVTPTGLFLEYGPYVLMIAIAGVGIALFTRNKRRDQAQAK